jgi:hypothetical protein
LSRSAIICGRAATRYYIVGGALDETSGYAKGPSTVKPLPEEVLARDYPEVVAVNPFFRPEHHEATFNLGLDVLLDAMENRAAEIAGGKRRRRGKAGAAKRAAPRPRVRPSAGRSSPSSRRPSR